MLHKVRHPGLKKTHTNTPKTLTIESVFLNFHSAKCYYSAVQPSESEPRSLKSSPRPHTEAAEWRQPSAPPNNYTLICNVK